MRADRLLSILMLLQARGKLTAEELAAELEVSQRTIYRDMDALSAAGVPVYAERGPGGGIALLHSYRTNLTGLTPDEVRALFMLDISATLAELGMSRQFKAALLKLSATLSPTHRGEDMQAGQRIHLDSTPWFQLSEPAPHLGILHEALWQDRRLRLVYALPFDTRVERLVDPYGLVAKAGAWYLVLGWDDQVRVLQVSRLVDARVTGETFQRPAGFDLARFWEGWAAEQERSRRVYPVTVRVAPELVPQLSRILDSSLGEPMSGAEPANGKGWITTTLHFETLEDARGRILGLGGALEVVEPLALRLSLADFARQVVALYG